MTGEPALTFPSAISLIVAVVAALFGLLTVGVSFGPGWRELREYSVCAALTSMFAIATIAVGMQVSPHTHVVASRLTLCIAGLHGSAWFAYTAAQEGRPRTRLEERMVILGIVLAGICLVPGAFVSDVISERRIAWLGWTYHDPIPTPLGGCCYGTYCGAMVMLVLHYARRWRLGDPSAAAHFAGLSAVVVAGVNDSLVSARLYDAPYALNLGLITAIVCVGWALTRRFVGAARSLDDQTTQLKTTQAALVQRERLAALGELSAVVAHEIRNPVSIMFNAITVLQRAPGPSGDHATLVKIVDDEARRLMQMVNDLLAFASPRALRLSKTKLAPILAGAAEAAHAITRSSAAVTIEVPPEIPPLECDERLVRQAVLNLITNALQACPDEPVSVSAKLDPADPKIVCIAVVDRGVGIPAECVPRLFTPFFTTRPTGTGLGLAIVRRVAEAHGGEVMLVASEGPGATFWLRLPLDVPSPDASPGVRSA